MVDYSVALSECIQTVSNFGSTTYANICDGSSHTVPWGALDWGVFLILTGTAVLIPCIAVLFVVFMTVGKEFING